MKWWWIQLVFRIIIWLCLNLANDRSRTEIIAPTVFVNSLSLSLSLSPYLSIYLSIKSIYLSISLMEYKLFYCECICPHVRVSLCACPVCELRYSKKFILIYQIAGQKWLGRSKCGRPVYRNTSWRCVAFTYTWTYAAYISHCTTGRWHRYITNKCIALFRSVTI